ncbi:MAG: elongation factor P maturation arginine rhamnosyltransferase EarP, partial [Burkholderiales bacterium]
MILTWDIFCRVVDNYGDIGVCWRLARQLAADHTMAVRLWVDNLDSFERLCPAIDVSQDSQRIAAIKVHRWCEPFPDAVPGDVVIEAFGCELPAAFRAAMAEKSRAPLWINLEYLSAEKWVTENHALPSPQTTLTKYFFFPGFVAGTGGLLRERHLIAQRDKFQRNP